MNCSMDTLPANRFWQLSCSHGTTPTTTMCNALFLLYKLLNVFRATMCSSSGAEDSIVLSPCVGIVPWLQEGCQNRLAGSVSSMDTLPANRFWQPSFSHGTTPTPTMCNVLLLLYKLLNMFRATMCLSSEADDCIVLSPRAGIVLYQHAVVSSWSWANGCPKHVEQLVKE